MIDPRRLPIEPITDASTAFGFLLGVLFHEKVTTRGAWRASVRLRERLGALSPIAVLDSTREDLIYAFARQPPIHPNHRVMVIRVCDIAEIVENEYGGDARNLWNGGISAAVFVKRLRRLPGIGPVKADIALFVLTHVFGVPIVDDGRSHSIQVRADLAEIFDPAHEPLLLARPSSCPAAADAA